MLYLADTGLTIASPLVSLEHFFRDNVVFMGSSFPLLRFEFLLPHSLACTFAFFAFWHLLLGGRFDGLSIGGSEALSQGPVFALRT